jgi:hypothetical protein
MRRLGWVRAPALREDCLRVTISWLDSEGRELVRHTPRVYLQRGDTLTFDVLPTIRVESGDDSPTFTDAGMNILRERANMIRDDIRSISITLSGVL